MPSRWEGARPTGYRNRWVRTRALAAEVETTAPAGPTEPIDGPANTHVIRHAGRTLALVESGFPHALSPDLERARIHDFDGSLSSPMTAHPKVDPDTGALIFFGYDVFGPPFLRSHLVDAGGALVQTEEIDVPRAVMMHDFGVTESRMVFLDLPVLFDLDMAVTGRGLPFRWMPEAGARVGILARTGPGPTSGGSGSIPSTSSTSSTRSTTATGWSSTSSATTRRSTPRRASPSPRANRCWPAGPSTWPLAGSASGDSTTRRSNSPGSTTPWPGSSTATATAPSARERPRRPAQPGLVKYDLARDEAVRFDPGEHRFPGEPVFVRGGRRTRRGRGVGALGRLRRHHRYQRPGHPGRHLVRRPPGGHRAPAGPGALRVPRLVAPGCRLDRRRVTEGATVARAEPWETERSPSGDRSPAGSSHRRIGLSEPTQATVPPDRTPHRAGPVPPGALRAARPDHPPHDALAGSGRTVRSPEFPGPILSGQVAIPSRKRRQRAGRRNAGAGPVRAHPAGGSSHWWRAIVVVAGLGYGYFRYQWSKVSSQPCSTCVAAANGAPYNVLLIGSDSRAGETAAEAQQFGSPTAAAGQRSDTIKLLHIDPANGTASSLSIPRDTYVTLSGMPADSQLATNNKINSAFAAGPDALIQTIESTFGIPISHYIVINFFGLQDAVNALGGISMDFPYPVRDQDCSTGVCYNNSGLDIPTAGCQVLNGQQALALSRSRYFEYEVDGSWQSDPTSDIGRIERQNLLIEAAIDKAKSTYNPLRLNALLSSVVHDFSKDNGLTPDDLFSLAERYHAFSGSQLQAYTLPTVRGQLLGGRRCRGSGPAR